MTIFSERSRWLTALFTVLLLVSAANIGRVIQLQQNLFSSGDFYTYWFYGHFLRTAKNPYIAYAEGQEPTVPVSYWDGRIYNSIPALQSLHAPTNTTPILLIVSSLANFSWHSARLIWLFFNTILALLVPYMAIRLLPRRNMLKWREIGLIYALFWASPAVRLILNQGQTVLLIMAFAIMSIWCVQRRRGWWAGILLGFALSKVSLTLPIWVVYLLLRRWRAVVAAVAVQLLGFVAVSWWSNTSVIETMNAYYIIISHHVENPGIHLTGWMPYSTPFLAVSTLILGIYLWRKWRQDTSSYHSYQLLHLVTIGSLWVLHAGYHNRYDVVVCLLFYVLFIGGIRDNIWGLTSRTAQWMLVWLTISVVLMMLPVDLIKGTVGLTLRIMGSLAAVSMLVCVAWLYGRVR